MKKFAVYFIPRGDMYDVGSKIVGYDIRNRKVLSQSYGPYGFHLTLTDVVSISQNNLIRAFSRVQRIFAMPFFRDVHLSAKKIDKMPNADVVAIQYKWNWKFFLLHFLLIVFVQRLGKNSNFNNNSHSFFRRLKIKYFSSPYILDDFIPHITLGKNNKVDRNKIISKDIFIDKLSVVVLDEESNRFVISTETI